MLVLAIDTAFERCCVGLYDSSSQTLLARREPIIGKGHAERLMALVVETLDEVDVGYGDVERIAVTIGPGSFTGLRVGVSATRGWALALGVPAVGVSTLEGMAASLPPSERDGKDVLTVLDAKRGEVYAALFDRDGLPVRQPTALTPDALVSFVGDRSSPLVIAGTGAAIAARALAERSPGIATQEAYVDVASLAELGASRDPAGAPSPLYLRGADAKLPAVASRIAFRTEASPQPRAE